MSRQVIGIMVFIAALLPGVVTAQPSVGEVYVVQLRELAAVDEPEVVAAQIASAARGEVLRVEGRVATLRLSPAQARMVASDPRVEAVTLSSATRAVTAAAETMPWSSGVAYEYDGSGNVRKIGTDAFLYDAAGRLVQSDTNGTRRNYEYDAYGNRTKCRESVLVVTATGKKNKAGASIFNVTLYNQNQVAMKGIAWSGGNGNNRLPASNYLILGDNRVPPPTTTNPNSSVWPGNPPPMWGIQQINPGLIDGYDIQASYGPIRARLNPIPYRQGAYDGNYYHGQDADVTFGSSHGCLCYGKDSSIIQYIWKNQLAVPVAVDMPVDQP